MNTKYMNIHTYRSQITYHDTARGLWKHIKHEAGIILTIFLLGAILLTIAVISDRARISRQNQIGHDNYQLKHLPVITPRG